MKPTFNRNPDGNWTLNANNYAIGVDSDFISHMAEDNQWTHNQAIDHAISNANTAISDAQLSSPEQIFDMIMSASFESWYENEFKDFVEGEIDSPSKQDIINFISMSTR